MSLFTDTLITNLPQRTVVPFIQAKIFEMERAKRMRDSSIVSAKIKAISACTFVICSSSVAAPVIDSATGTFAAGGTAVITGSQFGSAGPNIVLYEDFEPSSPFKIGEWYDGIPAPSDVSRTGDASHHASYDLLRADLGGNYSEAYISFWVKLTSPRFPGTTSSDYEFSSDSSWKFAWLMDSAGGYQGDGRFDLCLPTHVGGGKFMLAGNDFNYRYIENFWWSWDQWMRISVWLRDDSTNAGFLQTFSQEKGIYNVQFGKDAPFASGVTRTFSHLNFPGWMRSSGGDPVYDDIYVAVGNGSVAHVEITDSSSYENSTTIDTLPIIGWTDGSIEVSIPNVSVNPNRAYVFVTDASGQRNSVGYPFLCDKCPASPTVRVN